MSVGTEIPSCEASFWCCSGCCSYVGGVTQCVECGAPIPEPESDWGGAAEIVESPPVPPDFDHYEADIVSALDGGAEDGDAEPASLSDSSAGAGDTTPAKASGDGGCSVTGHSSPSAARPFAAFGFAAVGFTFIALLGGRGRFGP
jgi:hypothetical protein